MHIDEVIHQPVRTRIIALLIKNGEMDYSSIKKELSLSDGHMSTHMKKLIEADFVSCHKFFDGNKPKTNYRITKVGKKSFQSYVKQIESLIR